MFSKDKIKLILSEFLGTLILASVVLVVANMFGLGTAAWYISISAGATLALVVALFGSVSGAHVNPAVTLGLWTLRKINTTNALVYIAAQMLGGACALLMYNYLTNTNLPEVGFGSFEWRVFWAEMIGSAVFGMGIIAAISQKLKGGYSAFAIGGALTFGALVASLAAAGFLNPAVALANNSLNSTYLLAPILGMIVGMNLYSLAIAPTEKKSKK